MDRPEALLYIKNASLILLSILCVLFPSFFLTLTSEIFIFPKQLLVSGVASVLLLLFCLRTIIEGKITVKASPFNLPIVLLAVAVLASSLFSRNMFDSLIQAVPILMLLVIFFAIINTVSDKLSYQTVEFSLLAGSILSSIITVSHFLKFYIFPFEIAQSQYFNTHGSIIQQLIYIVPLLTLSVYYLIRMVREARFDYNFAMYAFSSIFLSVGLIVIVYQIITLPQKPILLPLQYGFQISLASISQDSARLAQSFLLGSGFGNFASVFTRFKPVAFNNEPDIWNLVFSYSSSFFLELVATAGILGMLAFLFLGFRVLRTKLSKMNGLYASLLVVFLLSFVLPFSFITLFLFVVLLGLYISYLYINKHDQVYDFTLSLIAWRQSFFNFTMPSDENADVKPQIEKRESKFLPFVFSAFVLFFVSIVVYFSVKLVVAEMKFRDSLSLESLNNGQRTYDLQKAGLSDFSFRSDYFRVFSQINLALATSILSNLPANSSPSAQTQQTVLSLLQQSINSGRAASTLAPLTFANWVQLSLVYRNLIGVGQNAESFSIASLQQAINLDPYNPNLYIQLGGIYYQLGLYEQAQNNFQIAVNLKGDLANARYNLGHALEAKGDFANALSQYRLVKQLVLGNPDNEKRIIDEIEKLESRLGEEQTQTKQQVAGAEIPSSEQNEPLEQSLPSVTLPPRSPQIKISPPPATITPTIEPTQIETPTPSPTI